MKDTALDNAATAPTIAFSYTAAVVLTIRCRKEREADDTEMDEIRAGVARLKKGS